MLKRVQVRRETERFYRIYCTDDSSFGIHGQLAGDNLASVSELSVECEIISFCAQYTADSAMNSTSLPQSTLTAPSTIISSSPSSPMPTNTTPVSMTAPGLVEKTSPPPSLLIDTSDDIVQPQSTKSTESYTSSHTVGTHAPSLPSVVEDMQGSQQHGKAPSIKSNKKADKQRKCKLSFEKVTGIDISLSFDITSLVYILHETQTKIIQQQSVWWPASLW